MNPMTALFFILSAVAFLAYLHFSRILGLIFAGLVILVSVYQVIHFRFHFPFRVDNLLFADNFGIHEAINPMAPSAAVGFILVNSSFILNFVSRRALLLQVLGLTVLIGAVFMLSGYLFNVPEFFSSIHIFPAFETCMLFLILAIFMLISQPEEGIIKILIGDLEGSRVGRSLVPITIAIPFIITGIRLFAEHRGWVSEGLGMALVVLSYIIILIVSLLITMSSLNTRDQTRIDFQTKINDLNNGLKEMNDELVATNEELAASNEEIRTANEELSTMNEQLVLASETIRAQDLIIIEQKEEALKRSQEHLEIIFANTKEEILLIDAEGKLVLFNNSLQDFIVSATGEKPSIGMFFWDMTTPLRREESIRLFYAALGGQSITSEAVIPLPQGEVIHFLKYEPVTLDGKVRYVILTSTDITDQQRQERQLKKQFEELEKTNFELDRFVYSVSHDLRAPLSSILGLINVAEMEKGAEMPFLSMIRGRINHLDRFIKDILNYSRNSRTELQLERVDFVRLVEEVKTNLMLIDGYDQLTVDLKWNNNSTFYSDPTRLAIIFNNLLSNSIKFQDYTKQDCTLQITITTNKGQAVISFVDNGIGIETAHIDKIFDMFYRGTERSKGSGLGLYIVKEAVAKLRGTIKVVSRFGEFTSIEIIIPNTQSGKL